MGHARESDSAQSPISRTGKNARAPENTVSLPSYQRAAQVKKDVIQYGRQLPGNLTNNGKTLNIAYGRAGVTDQVE